MARICSTLNPVDAVVRAVVALLGLSMWFVLAGCQTLGPAALSAGRGAYNDVIARTSSEQTLGLLVRLRYSDPVGLLMVSSVTAGLKFNAKAKSEAGFGPRANYAGNLVPFSTGVSYEDSPTISYTPVDGQTFLREWLAPLTLETQGWTIAAYTPCTCGRQHSHCETVSSLSGKRIAFDRFVLIEDNVEIFGLA